MPSSTIRFTAFFAITLSLLFASQVFARPQPIEEAFDPGIVIMIVEDQDSRSVASLDTGISQKHDPNEVKVRGALNGSVGFRMLSGHIRRGVDIYRDELKETGDENFLVPAANPSLYLNYDFAVPDLSLSLDLQSINAVIRRSDLSSVRDEIDLTLKAELRWLQMLRLGFGGILYGAIDNQGMDHTEELFVSFGVDHQGFSFETALYGDVDKFQGVYFDIRPGYSAHFLNRWTLSANAIAGASSYRNESFEVRELGGMVEVEMLLIDALALSLSAKDTYNIADSANHLQFSTGLSYDW